MKHWPVIPACVTLLMGTAMLAFQKPKAPPARIENKVRISLLASGIETEVIQGTARFENDGKGGLVIVAP